MLKPGQMIAHYRCVGKIGEGGMGVVYKVLDTRLDRHVALKVLRPELTRDPERRRQFLREARSAAAVRHPNIATIHAIEESADATFIVMELVEGRTLAALLADGPLPLPEALRIGCEIVEGMARAHESRVVHRDLKPDNVVVEGDGRVRILDFGLARILGDAKDPPPRTEGSPEEAITEDLSDGGRLFGTVAYMSPEQARGDASDARADIFSFGVTLYEMITGNRPFDGRNAARTLARVLSASPTAPSELVPDLPEDLDRTILRCLEKDPAARFPGSRDLLRELHRIRHAPGVAARARPDTSRIAVFPFAVRGSAEYAYLGAGMVDLLSTKLDGAGDLRSVDPHVILCCETPGDGGAIDPDAARATADRLGAGLFLLGAVLEIGGRLHIEATLYDAAEGSDPRGRASVQGAAADLLEMVDRLTADLLAGLGQGPTARLTRMAATSTRSLPALKAYLEGEQEMRLMRRGPAVEAFETAVRADDTFALAWYRLAVAALWSLQPEKAWQAAARARAHADRLTDRDRLLLEAFEAVLRGRNDVAERSFRGIVGLHPDDSDAWYHLGELLFHHGPQRGRPIVESRWVWERLVALDPRHPSALVHLGVIAANRGEKEEVRTLFRRVDEASPGSDSSLWMRALESVMFPDPARREAILRRAREASDHSLIWMIRFVGAYLGDLEGGLELAALLADPARSARARAVGHSLIAHTEAARGRPAAALREMSKAERIHPSTGILYRGLIAAHPFLPIPDEDRRAAREALGAPVPQPPDAADATVWRVPHRGFCEPLRLYLTGLLDVRLGLIDEAVRAAEAIESLEVAPDREALAADLALSVRAAGARERGDVEGAIALLDRARGEVCFYLTLWSPFYSQALERFVRAELLHEAGRPADAVAWYRSFADHSLFDMVHLGPALLRLGGVYEALGAPDLAAGCYRRALHLWRDAEPEMRPHADHAARRLKALGPA